MFLIEEEFSNWNFFNNSFFLMTQTSVIVPNGVNLLMMSFFLQFCGKLVIYNLFDVVCCFCCYYYLANSSVTSSFLVSLGLKSVVPHGHFKVSCSPDC